MSKNEFFMGCDVSKGYSDFVVLDDKENVIEKTLQLDDTFEGHSTLSGFLSAFFKTHEQSVLYVGIESTGGYENNWFELMLRLREVFNLKVTRLNPLCVKKHHEAAMRRNVTDDISAYNIAS
jgi:transposase